MARFEAHFEGFPTLEATGNPSEITAGEMLEVLRPAAMMLRDHIKEAVLKIFKQHTGNLASSIDFDEDYSLSGWASFVIKPSGRHGKSRRGPRSRAGPADRRYAKHKRGPSSTTLSNSELAYLLNYGTARIAATHFWDTAVDEIEDDVNASIEKNLYKLLKSKGLL